MQHSPNTLFGKLFWQPKKLFSEKFFVEANAPAGPEVSFHLQSVISLKNFEIQDVRPENEMLYFWSQLVVFSLRISNVSTVCLVLKVFEAECWDQSKVITLFFWFKKHPSNYRCPGL